MGKGGRAEGAKAGREATAGAEGGATMAAEAEEGVAGINPPEDYRQRAASQARPFFFSRECGPILVSPMLIEDFPREFPRSRQLLPQLPHPGTQFGAMAAGGAGGSHAAICGRNEHAQALQQDLRSFQA
jgi:hypothetical protein